MVAFLQSLPVLGTIAAIAEVQQPRTIQNHSLFLHPAGCHGHWSFSWLCFDPLQHHRAQRTALSGGPFSSDLQYLDFGRTEHCHGEMAHHQLLELLLLLLISKVYVLPVVVAHPAGGSSSNLAMVSRMHSECCCSFRCQRMMERKGGKHGNRDVECKGINLVRLLRR